MLSLLVKIFTLGLVDLDKNESTINTVKPVEQPKPVEVATPVTQPAVTIEQTKPVETVKPTPQVVKSIPVEVASAKQTSKTSGKKVVKPAEQKVKPDQRTKTDKTKPKVETDDYVAVNNVNNNMPVFDEPSFGTVSRSVESVSEVQPKAQDIWASSSNKSSRDDWSTDSTPTRSSSNDYSSSSNDYSSSSSSSSDSSSSSCSGGGCD